MRHWFGNKKAIFYAPFLFVLLFSVACGSSAEPVVVEKEVVKEVIKEVVVEKEVVKEVIKEVPVIKEVIKEVRTEVIVEKIVVQEVVVVATPIAIAPPKVVAEPAVNPGKVIFMVANMANEAMTLSTRAGAGDRNYGRMLHESLIQENDRKQMVPGIATAWEMSEDGLIWTFTIREGVKFHDGSELTAEDVVWSLDYLGGTGAVNHARGGTQKGISKRMDRIELVGSNQVRVVTKTPIPVFAWVNSAVHTQWWGMMPKRSGEIYDQAAIDAYQDNPIAAGPVKLVGRTPAYVMNFERHDDYYYQPSNGLPEDRRLNFRSLDLYLVPEEATRAAAVRAGDADIVPISMASKSQIDAGGGQLVFVAESAYISVTMVRCDESESPCRDKRVRQALDYAFDADVLRDKLYGPEVFQSKGYSWITPAVWGYTSPLMDARPFDPDKARQLLADAGYPGGKGFGTLIVNTFPSSAVPMLPEATQIAAEMWRKELGIDVDVRVGDTSALQKASRTGQINGQMTWGPDEPRVDVTSLINIGYADVEGVNRKHSDPEIARRAQAAVSILDTNERIALYRDDFFPFIRDLNYNIGVGTLNTPWGVGPRIESWSPYPMGYWPSALHTIILK